MFNIIFKERLSHIQAYTKDHVTRGEYYYFKDRIIEMIAYEMGYVIS